MKQPILLSSRRPQRGAVALVFGLTLVVLIGFAGLAIDLGRFFVIKSELQNAVDACALAAASQLRPGQNDSEALTRAVAYGRVFSTGGTGNINDIKNRANFQSAVVDIQASQITFSNENSDDEDDWRDSSNANYNTAQYAKCSYPLTGLPIFFMRVLNPALGTQTVSAMAVATLAPSSSTCAIPVGVCKKPGGTITNNFGFAEGEWVLGKTTQPYGTGNFGWIDFSPPGGGASELADLLTGSGQCALNTGDRVGEQGNKAGLAIAWNSRFGWYRGGGGQPSASTAPPDFTGYAHSIDKNWPSGQKAYNGDPAVYGAPGAVNYQSASNSHLPYQGDTPMGIPSQGYQVSSSQQHSEGMRRRIVTAAVVDCDVWNTNGSAQPEIEGWACVLMLHPIGVGTPLPGEVWDAARLEFLDLVTTPGSRCPTTGLAGSGGGPVPVLVQ